MRATIKEKKNFWFIFQTAETRNATFVFFFFYVICARKMKVKTRKLSAVLLLWETERAVTEPLLKTFIKTLSLVSYHDKRVLQRRQKQKYKVQSTWSKVKYRTNIKIKQNRTTVFEHTSVQHKSKVISGSQRTIRTLFQLSVLVVSTRWTQERAETEGIRIGGEKLRWRHTLTLFSSGLESAETVLSSLSIL